MPLFGIGEKELVETDWRETSGVDHPANDEEGWVLMKSADAGLDTLLKSEQAQVAREEALYTALSAADFTHAPEQIQRAAAAVHAYLKGEGYGEAEPAEKASAAVERKSILRLLQRAVGAGADQEQAQESDADQEIDDEETVTELLKAAMPEFAADFAALTSAQITDPAVLDQRISDLLTRLRANVEGPYEMLKRDFSDPERTRLAKKGFALPNRSYPIVTCKDVENAVRSIGRAPNRVQVIAHIKKRARALGCTNLLPDTWQ